MDFWVFFFTLIFGDTNFSKIGFNWVEQVSQYHFLLLKIGKIFSEKRNMKNKN